MLRRAPIPTRPAAGPRRGGEGWFAAALLVPSVIVVFGVVVYPVLRTLMISFFEVDSPVATETPFVGLGNYADALGDPNFWRAARQTAYFAVTSIGLEIVFGTGVALLLNAPLRARWLFRAVVILPWALPTIVNGAMWRWILNAEYGVLNALLSALHLQDSYRSWLGTDPFVALNMVIVADVWKNTSLAAFFLLAGLQTIPRELYEAARVDGAGPVRSFLRITLPMLRPTIAIVLVLRTIEAFKVFDIIYVMTSGGPGTSSRVIAYTMFTETFGGNPGKGAAVAVIMLLLMIPVMILNVKRFRSERVMT